MRPRFVETNVFVTILVLLSNQSDTFAARYVPIEVRLNGVVLLKGNDSDSGERDFDQVWDNLHTVQFEATEEFKKRYVKADTKEVILECTNKDAEEPDLVIDDSFGGDARPRTLRIHRVKPDRFGREWVLDNVQLKELFYEREMPRDRVAELVNPGRDRKLNPDVGKKRNVAVSVISNDVVLLEGSDDDDGRRDADAVWDNLPNVDIGGDAAT